MEKPNFSSATVLSAGRGVSTPLLTAVAWMRGQDDFFAF